MRWLLPPFLFLACVAVMASLHFLLPVGLAVPFPFNLLGLLPLVLGLAITGAANGMFRRRGTNLMTFDRPGSLVQGGLFRYSRNPMYLGFAVQLVGIAWLFGSLSCLWVPLAFIAACQFWYIPFEEKAMAASFGPAYTDYCRRVRRWL